MQNACNPCKILICDDDPMVLEALQEILEAGRTNFGAAVEIAACDGPESAVALQTTFGPQILLIDLYMCEERFAGLSIFESYQDISLKRIAMTAHGSRLNTQDLGRLAACNLDGLLAKQSPQVMLQQVYRIWQGERIFSSELSALLNNHTETTLQSSPFRSQEYGLSTREFEVIKLRAKNYKIKTIAAQLSISESSIQTHLSRVQNKFGFKEPPELASWFRQNNIDYFG